MADDLGRGMHVTRGQTVMEQSKAGVGHDPLDAVTDAGYRVVWARDFDGRVILVDRYRLVVADVTEDRADVARRALLLATG